VRRIEIQAVVPAALIVTPWHLIEALPAGVMLRKIERYRYHDYHYICLNLSTSDYLTNLRKTWFACECVVVDVVCPLRSGPS
jgi:hypothetical protein